MYSKKITVESFMDFRELLKNIRYFFFKKKRKRTEMRKTKYLNY